MPITKTFNNTSYSIPLEGELNWATLSDFLVALADYGQTINKQKVGIRVATASPVTVLATTDCVIVTDLTIAGAVAVNLPAGVTGQVFTVVDGKGDAGTNNITITPASGTINGAATYVIDSNRAGVSLAYNGTSWTVIAEFISSGDIPRNQIAAGTANHVIINDGSGDLSSEATLAASRGGLAADASAFTGYVKAAAGVFSAGSIAAGDLPSSIDATKIANGTVDNTEFQYLGGVTSDIQTQINAKADGAASSTNNAIARFDLATGKVLKNSTVTVDDTGTVAGVNDITPTTINSVAMANYLTTSNTKAVTNKDIDGGTASNTNRITIPKDTKTNLDALTRKEGTLVYASDLDKLYADDGSTLKEIGSGGSGINYLADYFTADTLGTVGNGNVTDTGNRSSGTFSAWQSTDTTNISLSVSGASPLRAPNCYLFTGSGNNASGATFVESPAFQLHVADLGKAVMVSFDLADVTADGNFDVCMVRYNSSGTYQEKISIAGFASGATPASAKLPSGVTKFSGFFISSATSTDYYALRIRRLAGTDVPRMDSIKVSPDTVIQGAAVTDWYTPTTAPVLKYGSTTATNTSSISAKLRRLGDSCDFKCKILFNGAANANGTIRVTIPDNLVVDTTKLAAASSYEYTAVADFYTNSKYYHGVATVVGGVGTNYLEFTRSDDSGGTAANWAGNTTAGSNVPSGAAIVNNDWMQFTIIGIPISGWSSDVAMANRAVEEYAYNTSTWDTEDTGTSNFGYGAAGALGGTTALTAMRNKRVRFQTPILPTDKLFLEVSTDRVNWVPPGGNWTNPGIVEQLRYDGTNYIGMGLYNSYYSVQTDTLACFGRYLYGTTGAYNGTWYWRVRKVSSGAAVGFPISPANLVKSIARYSTNAGQTLTSGAAAVVIDFEDKTFDTKSEVTTGASWKFTAKESGYYRVKAQLMLDSTAGWAAGEWLDMYIRKNGTNYTNFTKYFEAAVTGYALCTIEDVVQLNSGEYIDIAAAQNNGANISLYSAQSIQNFVNVEQIG